MSHNYIELRAICKLDDGTELIQTGIYVFDTATLRQCIELMKNGVNGKKITSIEFDTGY